MLAEQESGVSSRQKDHCWRVAVRIARKGRRKQEATSVLWTGVELPRCSDCGTDFTLSDERHVKSRLYAAHVYSKAAGRGAAANGREPFACQPLRSAWLL